jgi:hypothetical protein
MKILFEIILPKKDAVSETKISDSRIKLYSAFVFWCSYSLTDGSDENFLVNS